MPPLMMWTVASPLGGATPIIPMMRTGMCSFSTLYRRRFARCYPDRMTGTTHHPISREELSARLAGDRAFSGVLFAPDVALDDLDLTESRFEHCRFEPPTVRGADFSGAA